MAEELERFALEPEERTRRFSPHLALSRARLACGDVARAAASLEMARRLGEGDEAQRRELADRIATAAAAAERAARQASELREEALRRAHEEARRELLAGYVNLAAAAALGECDTAALARLEDKGFVRSWMSEATARRGGKPKRLFRVTPGGLKIARELHQARERIWNAIAEGKRA